MKKFLSLVLLLCCMVCANATVRVSGVVLKAGNETNSSMYGITNPTVGSIRLSSDGKTLTLKSVNISVGSNYAIDCTDQDLTIKLEGTNTLTTTSNAVLNLNGHKFTFTSAPYGNGKLIATASNSAALRNEAANITFNLCDVTLSGPNYTVWSSAGTITEVINVNRARLTIKNTGKSTETLWRIKELNMTECALANGDGFVYGKGVTDSSGKSSKGDILIEPDGYPVLVKGKRVNSLNRDDILGDDSGRVSYQPDVYPTYNAGLLYLNNATIEYSGTAIRFEKGTATRANVYVMSSSTVKSSGSGNSAIFSEIPLTVYGNQNQEVTLTLENSNTTGGRAIYSNGNLSIQRMKLNATAFDPIKNQGSVSGSVLTFLNCNVTATCNSTSGGEVISGFGSVSYSGCNVTSPASVTLTSDGSKKYYTSKGGKITSLTISKGSDTTVPTVYNLASTNVGYYDASFSWKVEDNMTEAGKLGVHYWLAAGTTLNGTWAQNGELSAGATSVKISGLNPDTKYTLRIVATDAGNYRGYKDFVFTTKAIIDYGIRIAGEALTSLDKHPVALDEGTYDFDEETNTLELNKAVINTVNVPAIQITNPNVTIKLVDHNYLNTSGDCPLTLEATTGEYRIVGEKSKADKLFLNADDNRICAYAFAALSIKDATVKCNTELKGNKTLQINNSRVLAKRIVSFTQLYLFDVFIKTPENGTYRSVALRDADGNIADKCEIVVDETFPIMVMNEDITSRNCDDPLGNGTVKYDPDERVLTLTNARLSENTLGLPSTSAIYSNQSKTTIQLEGRNYVYDIYSEKNLYIRGGGLADELSVGCTDEAIHINYGLSIYDCSIDCDGYITGGGQKLEIYDSHVTAKNIKDFDTPKMGKGIQLLKPANAVYDYHGTDSRHYRVPGSATEPAKIEFGKFEKYGLKIGDIEVTSANCYDVLGDGGSVIYNPLYQELQLNEANIVASNYGIKSSGIEDLHVKLIGKNKIRTTLFAPIAVTKGMTFTISGAIEGVDYEANTLELISDNQDLSISAGVDDNVRIMNCTVTGKMLSGGSGAYMTISNSVVDFNVISGFNGMILNGDYFDYNGKCHYDLSRKCIVNEKGEQLTGVKILPVPLVVDGVEVTYENYADILGNGSASYDFEDRVLTLTNARIGTRGILVRGDVTIYLNGENRITNNGDYVADNAINMLFGGLNIYGPGSLHLDGFNNGITRWASSFKPFNIRGCSLFVSTTATSSYGLINQFGGINITNANVAIRGCMFPLIYPYQGLKLQNYKSVSPNYETLMEATGWTIMNENVNIVAEYKHGDFDRDGKVDILDMTRLVNRLGNSRPNVIPRYFIYQDINGDGKMDMRDVKALEFMLLGK